jgi:hypothetical protein
LDGLVPTRRTCISMPGANPVVVFAGISILYGHPSDNSHIWLKGTYTNCPLVDAQVDRPGSGMVKKDHAPWGDKIASK